MINFDRVIYRCWKNYNWKQRLGYLFCYPFSRPTPIKRILKIIRLTINPPVDNSKETPLDMVE